MKKIYLSTLLPLAFWAFGCDSSEDVDGGVADSGVRLDATVRPDATVPPDSGPRPDGGPNADAETNADAEPGLDADRPDAEGPDAGPGDGGLEGPVTVRAYLSDGTALPIAVIFQDPTGAVVSSTFAVGQAIENLPPGSMVSLPPVQFGGKGVVPSMIVFTDVQPGDVYDLSPSPFFSDYIGNIEVTLPGYFDKANYFYYVDFGCGTYYVPDPVVPSTDAVYTECAGSSTTTVSVVATVRDDSDTLIAYSIVDAVTLVPGGDATVTMPDWETALVPVDLTMTNISTAATDLYSVHSVIRRNVQLVERYNGLAITAPGTQVFDIDTVPFGEGDVRVVDLSLIDEGYTQHFARHMTAGPTTLDFVNDFLPVIRDHAVSATSDEARPEIQWTIPSGANADGAIIRLNTLDPLAQWFFVVPGTATSVRVPVIPAPFDDMVPGAATQFDTGAMLFEANLVPNYGVFRTAVVPAFLTRGIGVALQNEAPIGLEAKMSMHRFYSIGGGG